MSIFDFSLKIYFVNYVLKRFVNILPDYIIRKQLLQNHYHYHYYFKHIIFRYVSLNALKKYDSITRYFCFTIAKALW